MSTMMTTGAQQSGSEPGKADYAVTGAGGFVGKRLVGHLLEGGEKVRALVRDETSAEELRELGATVRIADVTDEAQLREALEGTRGVFHLAALFNHPDRTWDDYRSVNVQGTLNVLSAAAAVACPRVVHCSTVGVATEAHEPPYDETTPYSPQPGDKYEVTKTEGEIAALEYASENDLSLRVVRPAQVYGPGDTSKAKFYRLVKKGIIVSPGRTTKHLIYVDDLCEAFVRAMQAEGVDGEIFLIAGAAPTPLEELVEIAADALRVPAPRLRLPAAPVTLACRLIEYGCNAVGAKPPLHRRSMDFFTKSIACRVDKAADRLGFRASTPVETGVKNTVRWLQDRNMV